MEWQSIDKFDIFFNGINFASLISYSIKYPSIPSVRVVMSAGKKDKNQDEATAQVNPGSESAHQHEPSSSGVSESRRRFAKAGLLATPILMSVASRPVLGQTVHCLSNALSGNLSNPDRGLCDKEGAQSPASWKTTDPWPSGEYTIVKYDSAPPDSIANGVVDCAECFDTNDTTIWICGGTTFTTVFTSSTGASAQKPMFQLLCERPNSAKAHAIAALLNSLSVPNYPLKPMQVVDLWEGGKTTYEAFLSHYGGFKQYLQTTWQ